MVETVQTADGVCVPVGECKAVLIERSGSRVAHIHQTLLLIKYLRQAEGEIHPHSSTSLT